jgi:thiamine biosynthesis lipoprotein
MSERSPFAERSPRAEPISGSIEIDGPRVRIPAGMRLDLGGIGKGWIADRLCAVAVAEDLDPCLLIDAGGDLVAATGEHVAVVENTAGPLRVTLAAGDALATSGDARRSWRNGDGIAAHHLIDPETGAPGPRLQATVLMRGAAAADVMAKVIALRPGEIATTRRAALLIRDGVMSASASWPAPAALPV